MTIKGGLTSSVAGLPAEAFAVVGNTEEPETWKIPHHKRSILKALRGRLDVEQTVDWDQMAAAIAALSPRGHGGQRINAAPEAILEAAKHLAEHHRKAGTPLPDTLAAIV